MSNAITATATAPVGNRAARRAKPAAAVTLANIQAGAVKPVGIAPVKVKDAVPATMVPVPVRLSNEESVLIGQHATTLATTDAARYDGIVAAGRYFATLYTADTPEAHAKAALAKKELKGGFMQARFQRLMTNKAVVEGDGETLAARLIETVYDVAYIAQYHPTHMDNLPVSERGLRELADHLKNPNAVAEKEAARAVKLKADEAAKVAAATLAATAAGKVAAPAGKGHGDGDNPFTKEAYAASALMVAEVMLWASKVPNAPAGVGVKLSAVRAFLLLNAEHT